MAQWTSMLAAAAAQPDLAPEELLRHVRLADDMHADRARYDPSAFASYVLRDEETAQPIKQQPMHDEWHALASGNTRLLIWSSVESGKTQQMSIARVLWEVGRNPQIRIVIVSNTDGQAQKICTTIAKYIESSAELHKVFPKLRRDKSGTWTKHELIVERKGAPKDPTVRSCGVHGNILGARIDLLIVDDILDYENTVSPTQRQDLWAWFQSTVEGRLTRYSRVICIGTAWHKDDIMHRWARRPEWQAVRYPIINELGHLSFPDRWPIERVEAKRKILGSTEFARQMRCIARSDEESRFKEAWITQCLARGEGKAFTHGLEFVPDGYRTFTGVDLGVRIRDGSDLTVLFTIIIHPDETREILEIQSGRWTGPDIVNLIIDVHRRYHSIVMVENVAAQDFILQFTKERSAAPVRPFNTGANKRHPEFGVESLAVELENAKWIIPSRQGRAIHSEAQAWINEMLYYDPAGHTGDRLMASWFAREGSRQKRPRGRIGHLDVLTR